MAKREKPAVNILDAWTERDLSRDAAAGGLDPAFGVDETLQHVRDVLSGGQAPVLVGERGVGKTAAAHEWVRRLHTDAAAPWAGRRVLQLSIRRRASMLRNPREMIGDDFQQLCAALGQEGDGVIPFFRDIHLADAFNLEGAFVTLALARPGMMLAEGERAVLEAIFEWESAFERHFVLVTVEEPSVEQTDVILRQWCAHQSARGGNRFAPGAIEQALYLSHRFLARNALPQKAIDLLNRLRHVPVADGVVTERHIIERFCQERRARPALVDPAVPLDLAELEREFNEKVLGQEEAVAAVVSMIGMIKAGLCDMRRPFGVFLFVGPTGVGKTHIAQLLAEHLFGSRQRMVRFNMADYPDEAGAFMLFGNPSEHARPAVRGLLTQRLGGQAFTLLLLDEFEKAHAKTHDRFLELMDEGSFVNGAGERISCRSTIIIATSNAGAEIFRGQSFGFTVNTDQAARDRELDAILQKHFRFEFLNRFDRIVHFHPLTREHIRTIARREMQLLRDRVGLRQRGLTLEVDESVLDWLAAHGYDADYGARFLRRVMERSASAALADVIVRQNPRHGTVIELTVQRNRIVARVVRDAPPVSRPRKAPVHVPVGTTHETLVLDRDELVRLARSVLRDGAVRLAELEKRLQRRSELLETMNEPAFWSSGPQREAVLDEYRELDVIIRLENRFARPIVRLQRTLEDGGVRDGIGDGDEAGDAARAGASAGGDDDARLARHVEAATEALREWEGRLADEGASSVWLVFENADPFDGAGAWMEDLVTMERAWCRKLGLAARVIAYGLIDDELARVAMEVEGPGAERTLAMEIGIHRLVRKHGQGSRVRCDVIRRSGAATVDEPSKHHLSGHVQARAMFDLKPRQRGRIELAARGLTIDFNAEDAGALPYFLHDLAAAWDRVATESLPTARVYGEAGAAARDPRTGATVMRPRDLERGELDPLFEAWRSAARETDA